MEKTEVLAGEGFIMICGYWHFTAMPLAFVCWTQVMTDLKCAAILASQEVKKNPCILSTY